MSTKPAIFNRRAMIRLPIRRAIARLAARAAIVLAALVPWLRLLDGTWGLYFFALALGGETLFVPLLALAAVSALTLLVILPAAAVWRVAARRQPSAVHYAVAGGLLLSAAFHLGAITVHAISYAVHPPGDHRASEGPTAAAPDQPARHRHHYRGRSVAVAKPGDPDPRRPRAQRYAKQ